MLAEYKSLIFCLSDMKSHPFSSGLPITKTRFSKYQDQLLLHSTSITVIAKEYIWLLLRASNDHQMVLPRRRHLVQWYVYILPENLIPVHHKLWTTSRKLVIHSTLDFQTSRGLRYRPPNHLAVIPQHQILLSIISLYYLVSLSFCPIHLLVGNIKQPRHFHFYFHWLDFHLWNVNQFFYILLW